MSQSGDMYQAIRGALSPGARMHAIIRRAHSTHLSWKEFVSMPLPPELDPVQAWEILQLANRCGGVDLPIPDLDGNEYWYHRNDELIGLISRLEWECRRGSQLDLELAQAVNRRLIVQCRVSETLSAARLDGLQVSSVEASQLLRLDRSPQSSTERLVLNTRMALDAVEAFVDEPFSPEMFEHFRQMLLRDVDVTELGKSTLRMGLLLFEYENERVRRCSERQLQHICDYANHVTGEDRDHPVLRALLLPDVFRLYRPLPDLNSQVGRLAFRVYTVKHGLPVLGLLPLSRMKLRWEEGSLPEVRPEKEEYGEIHPLTGEHTGNDLTPYMTLVARMASGALDGLHRNLDLLHQHDEDLRSMLIHRPEINHRQRSVLGRALANRGAEFRIAFHQTTHNVVYATARADLLELVDMGYLEMVKRGRAFVFMPHPLLKERLGVADAPAEKEAQCLLSSNA